MTIIQELESLLAEATENVPLPWSVGAPSEDYDEVYCRWHDLGPLNLPGEKPGKYELLMLAAVNALPALITRLRAMEAALTEQTDLVDRVCSAVERAEQDIGGEGSLTVLRLLGPSNDRARAALNKEKDRG